MSFFNEGNAATDMRGKTPLEQTIAIDKATDDLNKINSQLAEYLDEGMNAENMRDFMYVAASVQGLDTLKEIIANACRLEKINQPTPPAFGM